MPHTEAQGDYCGAMLTIILSITIPAIFILGIVTCLATIIYCILKKRKHIYHIVKKRKNHSSASENQYQHMSRQLSTDSGFYSTRPSSSSLPGRNQQRMETKHYTSPQELDVINENPSLSPNPIVSPVVDQKDPQ